ncbi:monooxygenase [Ramicandelaber brevisporus]|nr:monooxygenase [Ramicandelaber brevisporus]
MLRVGIVGAGFGGVLTAIRIHKDCNIPLSEITLFDSQADVGGVWQANTYPGAAVDIPSPLYSASFEPNPDWSHLYSPQAELQDYVKTVATKYNVYDRVEFKTLVTEARWSEDSKTWHVTTVPAAAADTASSDANVQPTTYEFEIFISAVGTLRRPKVPEMFNAFTGTKFHSSRWDHSVDISDKHVAVVGCGASAAQVIPAIVDNCAKLTVFQRTPSHCIPRGSYEFSSLTKSIFRYVPLVQRLYRASLFFYMEMLWFGMKPGSFVSWFVTRLSRKHLENQIVDPELRDKLQPKHTAGCKRILITDDYYPALVRPNVTVHNGPIDKVTASELIVTSEGESVAHKPDVLVLATGFQTMDFLAPLKVIGRNDKSISAALSSDECGEEGINTYKGILVADAPNFFISYGPGTNLGHNSIIFMLECQATFMVNTIKELQRKQAQVTDGGKVTVEAKPSAIKSWSDKNQKGFEGTTWAAGCSNWYRSPKTGRIDTLYSGNCTSYWFETRNLDKNDLIFLM